MQISGWGNFPVVDAVETYPDTVSNLKNFLRVNSDFSGITRSMGRSYGDSALSQRIINTRYLNHILAFDEASGVLECSAGVTLAEILDVIIPKGWFLPVTPGTKYISIGGAIASDVHGKNHHQAGCFSNYVESFRIMLANTDIVTCSKNTNAELFRASCGGMGLTGIILDARLQLTPINSSYITETTLLARDLAHALELFELHNDATYSVAWIDCLARGKHMGRSLLMLGEHAQEGKLEICNPGTRTVPFRFPGFVLNRFSAQMFNSLYYYRGRKRKVENTLSYDSYFYPLDRLLDWNRIYGKHGFVQYQFVVPKETGLEALSSVLTHITESNRGSFLSVLKAFGDANENYLSFPTRGYTLALDFKMDSGLLDFLNSLDKIVLDYNGRIYLAKDARMNEHTFKAGYPNWEQFMEVRKKTGAYTVFRSQQSTRLQI